MPEAVTTKSVGRVQYCDLVWLAYFVLPGKGKRMYRLAVARRIVDGTGSGRPGRDLARRRTRVLRKAMRPSRRLHIGLGPWLRALPVRLPDPALTAALARLDPQVRVACVLLRVAGLPRYEVRDQLTGLGVRDPWAVIEAAEAAPMPAAEVPEPFPAALVRPVRRRPIIPIAAAGALTVTLVGALVVTESGGSLLGGSRSAAAGNLRLIAAAPGDWSRGAQRLDAWPARGDLIGDKAFTARALDAWSARGGTVNAHGGAQLLYAGDVGGAPVALLRQGDRIARYTGPHGALEIVSAGADAAAPIALGSGRYLLSPWDTKAGTPEGGKVKVTAGVTEPVTARTRCGRGPILELKGPEGSRTVGDLGGPRAVVLGYHSPSYRPPASPAKTKAGKSGKPAKPVKAPKPVEPERLKTTGLKLWERLGCLLPQPARPVTEAMAWDFWAGSLPNGGKSADWVCTRMTFAGGGSTAQSTLLGKTEQHATGWCDDRKPVSGLWWRSPSDRWYYLAAAGRGLVPHAEGPMRSADTKDRLLVAKAPDSDRRPAGPVTLTARAG